MKPTEQDFMSAAWRELDSPSRVFPHFELFRTIVGLYGHQEVS